MNKINEIKKRPYEGYVWMSDTQTPMVINGEEYSRVLDNGENPFVIEARLYSRTEGKSISVRYVDGNYIAVEYDLSDYEAEVAEDLTVLAHQSIGSSLLFKRIWRPRKDSLCEGMPVLEPAEEIFVGFKK